MNKALNSRNSPKIRFDEFSGDWVYKPLKDIFGRIRNAFVGVSTPYYVRKGHFYLESNNIKDGLINRKTEVFINNKFYMMQKDKWLKTGDIVMVQSGHVGHSAVIPKELNNTAAHALIMFTDYKQATNPYFLNYQFLNEKTKTRIDKITTGNTIRHILSSEMKLFECFFPTYSEQKAIGNLFQTLDQTLILNRQKHDKTKTLKKALLSKLFPKAGQSQPEMRLKGFSGDWVEVRLGEVVDIVGGGTPDTTNPSYWNGDIDWYSPTEIGKSVYADKSVKRITQLGLLKSSAQILPANKTVLFTSRAGIGDMAILRKEGATNQGFQSLIAKVIDVYFLYSMGHILKSKAISKASGSTFLEISKKQLGDIELYISPIVEEQTAIANILKKLDETITLQAKQIKTLENLKKALLAKMFV